VRWARLVSWANKLCAGCGSQEGRYYCSSVWWPAGRDVQKKHKLVVGRRWRCLPGASKSVEASREVTVACWQDRTIGRTAAIDVIELSKSLVPDARSMAMEERACWDQG
jgi:hypothetical protein